MSIQELEPKLSALSPTEMARIIEMLAQELGERWLGIEKTAGVAGGEACIVRTRIPVWTLEGYRRLGWSDGRIFENFPALRSSDLLNAWTYAGEHPDEMEQAIAVIEKKQ